jgi:hypothetical protein
MTTYNKNFNWRDSKMKPFMQKVILPAIFAAFVCFSLAEQNGFVNRILVYVYGQDYYPASVPARPDGAENIYGNYWILTGEYQPVTYQCEAAIFQPPTWSSYREDQGELSFIVVEITEKFGKDGPGTFAPEGYVDDHDIVMVPEGAMYPAIVLWLRPIECTGFIVDGGLYCQFEHEVTQGVDHDLTPKLFMTYKTH